MHDEGGDQISKRLPYQASKIKPRPYIKDSDLQVQVALAENAAPEEKGEAFKDIYAHYSSQIGGSQQSSSAEQVNTAVQEVKHEMEEARYTYNMMMDISSSIAEAYQDLKKLE